MANANLLRTVAAIATVFFATWARAQTAPLAPVLPDEGNDTAVLPAAGPHRLLLVEPYRSNGVTLIDGDDAQLRTRGQVPVARNAAVSLSCDAARVYVAESCWSHGNRSSREGMLSLYDGSTLALTSEIPLPGRFIVVPKRQQVATSDDQKLAYVYEMIPELAVHVVDLAAGKVSSTVSIPRCALAYPFRPRSFATICGDRTLSSIVLDEDGASIATTPKTSQHDDTVCVAHTVWPASRGDLSQEASVTRMGLA